MGNGGKRVSCGHSRAAASAPQLGAFTEHGDRVRELWDNKSEWVNGGVAACAADPADRAVI